MTRKLQFFLTALLLMVGVTSAWADEVVEVIQPTVDGWIRYSSNTACNYSNADLEVKHYTKDATDNDFYAVMKFAIPNKVGMQIKSVSLRLVTEKSGAKTSMAVYKLTDEVTTSSNYSNLTNIETDLGGTALGTFTIKQGERSKQIGTDALTKEDYASPLSKWTNDVTLDKSRISMGNYLNIAIAITGERDGSDGSVNKFCSSRATSLTITNEENENTTTYAKGQLVPQLTITYEPADNYLVISETSLADGYVRKGNDTTLGSNPIQVVRKSAGVEMYGCITFNLAAQPGYELQSASLRLTAKRVKGDRNINIYKLNGNTAETAKYSDLSTEIETPGEAIISNYSVQGGAFDMTVDAITDAYGVINLWQNTFDITDYVKSVKATKIGIFLSRVSDATTEEIHFFTKDHSSVTNSKDAKSTAFAGSLTASDIQPRLVLVYKKMDSYTLSVTSAKAATLCLPFDATIPSGVTAYTLDYTSGDNINATAVTGGTLSANTPVLIISENATDYAFARTGEITDVTPTSGVLTGVYAETVVPADNYILTNHSGSIGFRKADGSTNKVQAYRAYMSATHVAGAREFFGIDFGDGETTGVADVRCQMEDVSGVYFDLSGRRVAHPTKGLYIVNGKKVVIK